MPFPSLWRTKVVARFHFLSAQPEIISMIRRHVWRLNVDVIEDNCSIFFGLGADARIWGLRCNGCESTDQNMWEHSQQMEQHEAYCHPPSTGCCAGERSKCHHCDQLTASAGQFGGHPVRDRRAKTNRSDLEEGSVRRHRRRYIDVERKWRVWLVTKSLILSTIFSSTL